jgi:hypothetical protein
VRRPGRLSLLPQPPHSSSSLGRRLLEQWPSLPRARLLGSSSPSAAAPALPAAPSTSTSPTVKSHRSVALAARPVCRSCAAACRRPPVLPSAFTGRRPAALLHAGRPEVPIESRGEDFVLLPLLHLQRRRSNQWLGRTDRFFGMFDMLHIQLYFLLLNGYNYVDTIVSICFRSS